MKHSLELESALTLSNKFVAKNHDDAVRLHYLNIVLFLQSEIDRLKKTTFFMKDGSVPSYWEVQILPFYWIHLTTLHLKFIVKLSFEKQEMKYDLFDRLYGVHEVDAQFSARFIGYTYRNELKDLMEIIVLGDHVYPKESLTFRELVTLQKIG